MACDARPALAACPRRATQPGGNASVRPTPPGMPVTHRRIRRIIAIERKLERPIDTSNGHLARAHHEYLSGLPAARCAPGRSDKGNTVWQHDCCGPKIAVCEPPVTGPDRPIEAVQSITPASGTMSDRRKYRIGAVGCGVQPRSLRSILSNRSSRQSIASIVHRVFKLAVVSPVSRRKDRRHKTGPVSIPASMRCHVTPGLNSPL